MVFPRTVSGTALLSQAEATMVDNREAQDPRPETENRELETQDSQDNPVETPAIPEAIKTLMSLAKQTKTVQPYVHNMVLQIAYGASANPMVAVPASILV
jgi:hypothetical protein